MKKRHCPKLWPLVKRFGWMIGLACWWSCRQQGCDWTLIRNKETIVASGWMPNGEWYAQAWVKARCDCCESVKQFPVLIIAQPDGQVMMISPGTKINVVRKEHL